MSMSGIYGSGNHNCSYQDQVLRLSYITAASGWLGTTASNLSSILALDFKQQTLLVTNNHASNTVYIGFISTMTSGAGFSYKVTAGNYQAIQCAADVPVYALATATSSLVTVVRGV